MNTTITTTTTDSIDVLTNSFEKFVRTRVSNGNPSQSTVRTYMAKIRYFIQWCLENNINPGTCTEEDIIFYRSHLINKSYKPNTIKLYLRIVNRFYTALVLNHVLPANPAKNVKSPTHRTDRAATVKAFTKEELSRCLNLNNLLDGTEYATTPDLQKRLILSLMSLCGLRTVEVSTSRIGNIQQYGTKEYGLEVTSKRSTRVVALPTPVVELINAYIAKRVADGETIKPNSPLISSTRKPGTSISTRGIRKAVDRTLYRAKLKRPGMSGHSLRHSFATLAVRGGADIQQVSYALGHADLRTTQVYTHIRDKWKHNPSNFILGYKELNA